MQQVALEFPAYGYRRITFELNRRGFAVNHKRVLRLMRADNLLCLRHKSFVVTTDSRHHLPVYPNLARDMIPNGVNQLWVADITYIRLRTEFIYLAVVLDAFSRRVIGWAVGRTLEAGLAVSALTMALRQRQPKPGLTHHSDRGVQYASHDYTGLLKQHGIQISMSRKGNPYDNAACESFMKTLKYEEVYRTEYRDLADAYAQIGEFLERVYNQQRLHSALGLELHPPPTRGVKALFPVLSVPIPNTEVEPLSPDDTARTSVWDSKTFAQIKLKSPQRMLGALAWTLISSSFRLTVKFGLVSCLVPK